MRTDYEGFISVLDSGVGGLTILRRLRRDFPRCGYLYIADGAYCPYGVKTPDRIYARVRSVASWAVERGCCAVVLACNTASIFADVLARELSVPIFDVIGPTCRLAASLSRGRIALLATDATVASGAYQRRLTAQGYDVAAFACSALVPYAESGERSARYEQAVRCALKGLREFAPDTVILGCTHFPLLRDDIARHTGDACIVECVTDFRPPSVLASGGVVYLTTGAPPVIPRGIADGAHFLHVDIPDRTA